MRSRLISDYVYLAEASYADFSGTYDTDKKAIINISEDNPKPSEFAKLVTDHYTVEAHWQDRVDNGLILDTFHKESGFSGTLFKSTGKDSNGKERYVLAFKGTDGGKDLFIADAGDIVNDDLAESGVMLVGNDNRVDQYYAVSHG